MRHHQTKQTYKSLLYFVITFLILKDSEHVFCRHKAHPAAGFLSINKALETFEEHQQILVAIKAKDSYAAKNVSDKHLITVGKNLDIITQLNK